MCAHTEVSLRDFCQHVVALESYRGHTCFLHATGGPLEALEGASR